MIEHTNLDTVSPSRLSKNVLPHIVVGGYGVPKMSTKPTGHESEGIKFLPGGAIPPNLPGRRENPTKTP